jgi:ankyrin repeat protein
VVALLATGRVDANSKDTEGQTPLSKAAEGGHEAVAAVLLATGPDAAVVGCRGRNETVVAALLATGWVDTDSKDTTGWTLPLRAAEGWHGSE